MTLQPKHFHLLDDLISDFGDYEDVAAVPDGWFHLGPDTQQALREIFDFLDELYPEFQPCECGCRDVVCAECGTLRGKVEDD